MAPPIARDLAAAKVGVGRQKAMHLTFDVETASLHIHERNGRSRFVERAVALAEPRPFDQFTASEIPVWLPFDIERCAGALVTRFPPADDELRAITSCWSGARSSSGRLITLERGDTGELP